MLLLILICTPVQAQFGRWWWDGLAEIAQEYRQSASTYEWREYRFGLGLNGYLGHPSIGKFRLHLDSSLSEFPQGGGRDFSQLGYGVDLSLLPQGNYRGSLYFNRQTFGFDDSKELVTTVRDPDVTTAWGATAAIRRGLLGGMSMGLSRSETEFVGLRTDTETRQSERFNWNRRIGRLRNRLRVERNARDYAGADLEIRDQLVSFSQQLPITPLWHWNSEFNGLFRQFSFVQRKSDEDRYRVRSRLRYGDQRGRQLSFDYGFSRGEATFSPTSVSHSWAASASQALGEYWFVGPRLSYLETSTGKSSSRSLRPGFRLGWNREGERMGGGATASISRGEVRSRGIGDSSVRSTTSYSLTGSFRHGTDEGLRKRLEIQVFRSELRRDSQEEVEGLMPVSVREFGIQDSRSMRLALGHRFGKASVESWLRWEQANSADSAIESDFDSDSLTFSTQLRIKDVELTAAGGKTTLSSGVAEDQLLRHATIRMNANPTRFLSLGAWYRLNEQETLLLPRTKGTYFEANLEWRVGALSIVGRAFERYHQLEGSPGVDNRGVSLSLLRRFAGWLPVTTGDRRRGVIR